MVRDRVVGIRDEHKQPYVLMASGEKHYFADYHTVFCSIDLDDLWGEDTLPYTGRMMIPLLIPGLASAFPDGAESLHYSSCEFQTRVTEMKVITQPREPGHADSDRGAGPARRRAVAFRGTRSTTRSSTICSPRRRIRSSPSRRSRPITPTSIAAGRSRICATSGATPSSSTWGMPETVNSAYLKALEFPPV